MRYTPQSLDDDWSLLEIERDGRRPCSDAYIDDANDRELVSVLSQLMLLRAAGCPPDPTKGLPNYQKAGKYRQSDGHLITVHVLKAKPSRWRLYYFVEDPEKKRIVFLYAVSKKTDKRDPQDLARCKRLLEDLERGRYSVVPIELPTR